jgi:hypothetical protein
MAGLLGERYVVITSDSHVGAPLNIYRQYLEKEFLEEFDAWRDTFVMPFPEFPEFHDPTSRAYKQNYDVGIRTKDLETEGVVGEIDFPNTIPPFFRR